MVAYYKTIKLFYANMVVSRFASEADIKQVLLVSKMFSRFSSYSWKI